MTEKSGVSQSVASPYCECCERQKRPDEIDWAIGRDGEDFCADCWASLVAETQRMIETLPQRIALCPQCAPEFYYPLRDGEGLKCPTMDCGLTMIVYEMKS